MSLLFRLTLALASLAGAAGFTLAAAPLRSARTLAPRSAQPVAVVIDIASTEEFDESLKTAGDSLVVVDYSTSWCGPCKIIAPKFDEFSEQYKNVVFLKVMGDSTPAADKLMRSQGVRALPSFHFVRRRDTLRTPPLAPCRRAAAVRARLQPPARARVCACARLLPHTRADGASVRLARVGRSGRAGSRSTASAAPRRRRCRTPSRATCERGHAAHEHHDEHKLGAHARMSS